MIWAIAFEDRIKLATVSGLEICQFPTIHWIWQRELGKVFWVCLCPMNMVGDNLFTVINY
jgi:hypothetical protein